MEIPISYEEKGIKKGMEKGIEQGIKKVAQEMLKEGCSIEFIANVTHLTSEEIAEMKRHDSFN